MLFLSCCVFASACSKSSPPTSGPADASLPASAPVAAVDPLALPDGALGGENLQNYASGAMDFVKKDEFSPIFKDTPLVGRQFKVTVPYDKYDSSLYYAYNAEKGILSVWVNTTSNYHRDHQAYPPMEYVILRQESHYGTPVPMSNAFGATKAITPVSYRTYGIGSPRAVYMGVFPKAKYSERDYIFYDRLEKEVKLSPDAARAGVEGLAMDVEGVVTGPLQGHPVSCAQTETTATIDYAYKESWNECVTTAKLTRVSIHSPSLGVIAEWSAASSKSEPSVSHKS